MSVTINGTNGLTFNDASTQNTAATGFGFKNRIINGDMRIDQRNAGASYTITGDVQYGIDRFVARTYGGSGRFSMQQVTDAPADFLKSLKVTVTTTDTSGTYGYSVEQRIEGLNITDFNFGTASAATYTMSFWVKASIAGTYTCGNRTTSATSSCVNTYTINSANTWEKKTIVFPANTGFTTGTDNGVGLICDFGFGAQTSKATSTLNVWQAGNYLFNSGQVDLMATSGATFYITGVQLEKGSTATSFDYRPYGTELALCQRYYQKLGFSTGPILNGFNNSVAGTTARGYVPAIVSMRSNPSALETTGTATDYRIIHSNTATICSAVPTIVSSTTTGLNALAYVASGLTLGQGSQISGAVATAYLAWSAEL